MIAYNINPATREVFDTWCQRCSDGITRMQTDKIIRNMVRQPASLHTVDVAASHVYNGCNVATGVNWNQMSDRNVAHIQRVIVPSHGDSTKRTLTRARPGACSAGGVGVDVKHGSYDRYLARLKGKSCNPVIKSTDTQILTSTYEFSVGGFCWALLNPAGPFYKATVLSITPTYTIQFVNGDGNTYTRSKSQLLTYACSC
jgi:hypothetical protein